MVGMFMYNGLDFPKELGIPNKIEDFNGRDARKFFNWLMRQIPVRLEYLQMYIKLENIILNDMYSDDALQIVNEWYNRHINYFYLDKEDIVYHMGMTYEQLSLSEKTSFTVETNYIAMDVALYFCDYLCKRINGMYWEIFKEGKKSIFYNCPVIKNKYDRSFSLEPNAFIKKYNWNFIENHSHMMFFDMYKEYMLVYGKLND